MNLIAVVADADAEWTLRTLLGERQAALSIRPIKSQVVRDPGRDAGVFRQAPDLLRLYLNQADYALVMLDREGSGVEACLSAEEMEDNIEDRLMRNGWRTSAGEQRAAAIVLDPELEIWVWSQSPHVACVLGLTVTTQPSPCHSERYEESLARQAAYSAVPEIPRTARNDTPVTQAEQLRLTTEKVQAVLAKFTILENGKPQRPKEAMLAALRVGRKPSSSKIFQELAQTVSLQSDERAFAKLRRTLQAWFG
jgi:hypothetical protein